MLFKKYSNIRSSWRHLKDFACYMTDFACILTMHFEHKKTHSAISTFLNDCPFKNMIAIYGHHENIWKILHPSLQCILSMRKTFTSKYIFKRLSFKKYDRNARLSWKICNLTIKTFGSFIHETVFFSVELFFNFLRYS